MLLEAEPLHYTAHGVEELAEATDREIAEEGEEDVGEDEEVRDRGHGDGGRAGPESRIAIQTSPSRCVWTV
jgi:hypothetical protein